jgi:hypothetical protein
VNTRGVRLEYNSDTDFWDTYVDGSDDYNFAYNGSLKSYINDSDGSYNIASDRRLKSQIQPIHNVLQSVLSLAPATYSYIADPNHTPQIGLIAQEVELLFPQAVNEKDGFKAINYAVFGVLAIQAIKEQQALLVDQQARIEILEQQVNTLMTHLESK